MIEFFKAYDIRAHDKDLNEQTMDRVGQALVAYFQKNNYNSIVLGMDMRETSPMILEILKERALSGGLDITLIQGIGNKTCSTPLFNFTCSLNPEKAGIMITASHNPANYNGLKVNAPSVNAIGYLEGLNKVEELYEQNVQREVRSRGRLESAYPLDKYIQETCEQLALDRNGFRGVKIAYDCANSMSCVDAKAFFDYLGADVKYINDWQDGTFPSHDSNPMKPENLRQLRSLVSKGREFFCGATADGDADRIGMVDEKSRILHAHNITSLVVHNLMRNIKDEDINVVYTTTMGRSFRDAVEQYKGKGHRVPVGRVGVINKGLELMNQGKRVIIGAEGSNHIMFPDKRGKFYENTILATGAVINQCVRTGEKLSEIIDKTNKYDFLGEQNYRLPGEAKEAKEKVSQLMARLEKDYAGIVAGTLEKDDGTLVESREKGEWFSIRSSNTEPVIRMNVESTSEKRTCEISAKLEEIIAKFGGKSE